MASAVVSDNFETGSGGVPQLGGTGATTCKAWVNFNGTGTVAIRDSYNVSSITDVGTGLYTVNFTSNMSNANYSVTSTAKESTTSSHSSNVDRLMLPSRIPFSVSNVKFTVVNLSGALRDTIENSAQVFSN